MLTTIAADSKTHLVSMTLFSRFIQHVFSSCSSIWTCCSLCFRVCCYVFRSTTKKWALKMCWSLLTILIDFFSWWSRKCSSIFEYLFIGDKLKFVNIEFNERISSNLLLWLNYRWWWWCRQWNWIIIHRFSHCVIFQFDSTNLFNSTKYRLLHEFLLLR